MKAFLRKEAHEMRKAAWDVATAILSRTIRDEATPRWAWIQAEDALRSRDLRVICRVAGIAYPETVRKASWLYRQGTSGLRGLKPFFRALERA